MSSWQNWRTVILMLVLCVTSVAAYLFYGRQLYFCLIFSVGIIVAIVTYMVYANNQAVKKMSRMVESIRYGDFSLNFSTGKQAGWEAKLLEDINEVMAKFRSELAAKEERHQYYETLLQIVDSCLLVIDRKDQVLWMNRSAEQELCGHRIHRLEELDSLDKDFSSTLREMHPGEVKVIRIYRKDVMQDMAVAVTDYFTSDTSLRLVNLRNIRSVLEENEMEAWQKLVRVLTHEIMNSITPIISLSDTLCERTLQQGMDEDSLIWQGMKTIHRRSKGLLTFVENYRKLSRLSAPVRVPVRVGDWLGDIKKLFASSSISYISGSLKFNSPPLFSFSSQRKEKIGGSSSILAHSSMVVPFQYFGTWERGREVVVYLGCKMAGLGNRTLCHSLCHSVCDPDLFPAFLTPPLTGGK